MAKTKGKQRLKQRAKTQSATKQNSEAPPNAAALGSAQVRMQSKFLCKCLYLVVHAYAKYI